MDTEKTATMILKSIQAGKTTTERVMGQMAQMEEALNRGAEVIGLKCTPVEAREVIRLVRAGLQPMPPPEPEIATPAPTPAAKIESQAAVTMMHTPHDALLDAIDHTETMRITTQHAASSYSQPVVVRQDGAIVDYAAIAAIHLLGSSQAEAEQVARALDPFGIRITFQPDGRLMP